MSHLREREEHARWSVAQTHLSEWADRRDLYPDDGRA